MKSPATPPRFFVRTNDSVRGNGSARGNDYARSFCPRCDDVMVAPARSQHVKEDVVRHHWRCESCGHQFRTSVRLSFTCVEAVRQVAVA
jgi:transcription elongation factor Elf1